MTIEASENESSLFEVESVSSRLEELAALYLFLCSGSAIFAPKGALDDTERMALQKIYAAELQRATRALWHHSSNDNPYPNLPPLQ